MTGERTETTAPYLIQFRGPGDTWDTWRDRWHPDGFDTREAAETYLRDTLGQGMGTGVRVVQATHQADGAWHHDGRDEPEPARPAAVLDPVYGERAKTAGMARADAGAGEAFRTAAMEAVQRVARRRATFTTDDVWRELPADLCDGRDGRALGPVMKKAQRLGFIEPTQVHALSAMGRCHRRPKRAWRSKVVR